MCKRFANFANGFTKLLQLNFTFDFVDAITATSPIRFGNDCFLAFQEIVHIAPPGEFEGWYYAPFLRI